MEEIRYIIVDSNTDEFYRYKFKNSWYSKSLGSARIFSSEFMAAKTIKTAGHHVMYPDRKPVIHRIKLTYIGE